MLAWQMWLVVAVALGVLEIVTAGFFVLWFAIGAVAAAIAAALGAGLIPQLVVFLGVSAVLVLFTRPVVQRLVERKQPAYKTNASALEGKVGTVVNEVRPLEVTGLVKVGGEVWTAVTDGPPIPAGLTVVVQRIDGVKLHVRPAEDRLPE